MRVRSINASLFAALFLCAVQCALSQTNKIFEFAKLPAETKSFLLNADQFTLLSLDPYRDATNKMERSFRWHRIVGATLIGPNEERTRLVNALENGIANGQGPASCFNPRHGIRAKKGDQTMDCLICFECGIVKIYSNSATNGYVTSSAPGKTFNTSLAIHNVRVAAD